MSHPPLAQRLPWGEGTRASGSAGTGASGPHGLKGAHYDLTSIMATTRKLFGMPDVGLTGRDRAAPTFEHVLSLSQPRTSASTASAVPAAPLHLPAAPPRARSGVGVGASTPAEALDAETNAEAPSIDADDLPVEADAVPDSVPPAADDALPPEA